MLDIFATALMVLTSPATYDTTQEYIGQFAYAVYAEQEQKDTAEFRELVTGLLPVEGDLADQITAGLRESCREFGVDRKLMLSLMYVESTGNPAATSHVGAIGLTQVMPKTGKQIASELGVKWTGPEMLYDVRINIRFGTYYMSKLLKRFKGHRTAAVQSYNWGPTAISRMLRNGQTIPTGYATKVFRAGAQVSL